MHRDPGQRKHPESREDPPHTHVAPPGPD
jgi:hypothetical protein